MASRSTVAIVPHGEWEERWSTLGPGLLPPPPDDDAAVIRVDAFGPGAGERGPEYGAAVPTTRLVGGDGPGLGGSQALAIAGRQATPVRIDGRLLGFTCEDEAARWCWLTGLVPPDPTASRVAQAEAVFDRIERGLAAVDLGLDRVVRTWFFLDRILDWYDEFNRVRTARFAGSGVLDGTVPASTGIGLANAAGGALAVDLLAVRPRDDGVRLTVPDSPLQGAATAYGSSFSRAVELTTPAHRRLLVSGTASIDAAGATVHVGDSDAQIGRSVRVVEAILAVRDMGWSEVTRATAYVKRKADAPRLAAWCREHGVGGFPLLTVAADICRDDLLFEIEVDACRPFVAWG